MRFETFDIELDVLAHDAAGLDGQPFQPPEQNDLIELKACRLRVQSCTVVRAPTKARPSASVAIVGVRLPPAGARLSAEEHAFHGQAYRRRWLEVGIPSADREIAP